MMFGPHAAHSSASLTANITEAERTVLHRRADVRLRRSTLASSARRELTSPRVLLLAVGCGFAVAQFTKRGATKHMDADGGRAPSGRGFLDWALKSMTLIRGFLSLLQVGVESAPKEVGASENLAAPRSR